MIIIKIQLKIMHKQMSLAINASYENFDDIPIIYVAITCKCEVQIVEHAIDYIYIKLIYYCIIQELRYPRSALILTFFKQAE